MASRRGRLGTHIIVSLRTFRRLHLDVFRFPGGTRGVLPNPGLGKIACHLCTDRLCRERGMTRGVHPHGCWLYTKAIVARKT